MRWRNSKPSTHGSHKQAMKGLERKRLLAAPTDGGRDKPRIRRCQDICTRFITRSALVAGADVSRRSGAAKDRCKNNAMVVHFITLPAYG